MSNLDTLFQKAKALADEANILSRETSVADKHAWTAAHDVNAWALECLHRINEANRMIYEDRHVDPFDALLHRIETGATTADDAEIVRQMARPS